MPINFPNAPALNEEFVHQYAYRYQWDGVKWIPVGLTPVVGAGGVEGRNLPLGFMSFEEVALDPNTVLCIAPQFYHPWIKDYAGLYEETEFSNITIPFPETDQRGLMSGFTGRPTGTIPYRAALLLPDEVIIRSVIRILQRGGTASTPILQFGGVGETEPTNFLWTLQVNVATGELLHFAEYAGGIDSSCSWFMSGGFEAGEIYVVEVRRTADGRRTAWVNGLQLGFISSSTGGTIEGPVFAGQASGGTTSTLKLPASPQFDVFLAQVNNLVAGSKTALEFAQDKRLFTDADIFWLGRDHFAEVAAHPDILWAVRATDAGVVEYIHGYTVTSLVVRNMIDDIHWYDGSGGMSGTPAQLNTDNITVNVIQQGSSGSAHYWVDLGASGESLATNYLMRFGMTSTTNLYYFAEYGSAGINLSASWTVEAMHSQEIREFRLTREAISGTMCRLRAYERRRGGEWALLVPTTGGEFVEQRLPEGGASTTMALNTGSTKYVYSVEVYLAVLDPTL